MKKIIFIFLFLGAIIGLFILFYQSFEEDKKTQVDVLSAIPQSAALIFETDHAGDLWHDLSQSNLIWAELQATDMYFRLNEVGLALDSMLAKQPDLRSYLADLPSVVSIHAEGSSSYSYLLAMPILGGIESEDVIIALRSLLRVRDEVVLKDYDGVMINSMKPKLFDDPIHVFVKDGVLVISLSEILAEESVRALQQDASINSDKGFMQVHDTKGMDARGELYINYAHVKSIVSEYAAPENKQLSFFKQPFAQWSALDLDLKVSSASLNGFVLCNDSTDAWLGSFRNVKETEIQVLDYMPSNTAFFAYFGFGDYHKFRANQRDIRERTGQKYSFDKALESYNESCNCEIETLSLDWIGTQVASFITEPVSENYVQNHYAVFRATDVEEAWINLLELENKVNEKMAVDHETETYKGHEIHQLKIGDFYGDVLSQAFAGIKDPQFLRMDDMIVMANSVNALRSLVDGVKKGNTLANDEGFQELTGQFSSESQFLMYSSLARSPFIYQNILDEAFAKDIAKQTEVLRSFQAFIYEVSYFKNDLFYNNIFFKHNPTYEQETNSLWEMKLPAEVLGKPHFVTNHYTGAKEIVVQDIANRIYLLSNTGKVVWEKALDGPIMGDITQIDIYRNKKLQMLFNTEKSIYLLDRNGGYVESFPVRLSSPASAPVSVADYDKSRDYRVFITMQGGGSALYDATGKKVEGWSFSDSEANLVAPIEHIRIRSKDYLYTANASGKIHLLNRKGKSRHDVSSKLENGLSRGAVILIGNKIGDSDLCYMDSVGNAFVLGFDDRFEKLALTDEAVQDFAYVDVDHDGNRDWVVLTNSGLTVFQANGDEIYSVSTTGIQKLQVFNFKSGVNRLGLTDEAASQITLYDRDGSVHEGFPLYGESEFVIDDMNGDGNYNLITAGADGFVYAYAIED